MGCRLGLAEEPCISALEICLFLLFKCEHTLKQFRAKMGLLDLVTLTFDLLTLDSPTVVIYGGTSDDPSIPSLNVLRPFFTELRVSMSPIPLRIYRGGLYNTARARICSRGLLRNMRNM